MKRTNFQKPRKLLSEFSSALGNEILSVRIYRDREKFICERRLVKRDGTTFTMVLPFVEPQAARVFLSADPYYSHVQKQIRQVLVRLDRAWQNVYGKAPT